ncbi:MAG: 4Fe-4S binding protein [Theionarchaea archaeon]|nr:4Fe-4S binding protein [Theionarchaea archaeon]
MSKTKITLDYTRCGVQGVDPRECGKCLRVCDPAIFLMHQPLKMEQDPYDPQLWQITAVWLSLCTRCMKCVDVCPEKAITISW